VFGHSLVYRIYLSDFYVKRLDGRWDVGSKTTYGILISH